MSLHRAAPWLLASLVAFQLCNQAACEGQHSLADHGTLPVLFTKTVSSAHAKPGDPVHARTTQAIRLQDGRLIRAGASVWGHVVRSSAFVYNKAPYAQQMPGSLEISLDSLDAAGDAIPLHVTLRALADPFTSIQAFEPASTDIDSLSTTTQVGGDLLVPSQSEIRNRNGDVVGYNKRDGQFAHLIANRAGRMSCDAGTTEQPVSRFSASACGLYGFGPLQLSAYSASRIALESTHASPEIPKNSTALLEEIPASETAR